LSEACKRHITNTRQDTGFASRMAIYYSSALAAGR
jgi:hypothetical protein